METIYLCIVIFLLCLAVFDLFVGVSNDAVNFLQSAVGARVATFRTVLILASVAVVLGAVLSSGMMDIARHGIMMPTRYSLHEVMTVFLAVMVTDVILNGKRQDTAILPHGRWYDHDCSHSHIKESTQCHQDLRGSGPSGRR